MKKKILISTGGSGGHVIPALNFYDHLKDNYEVFLATDIRGSKFINSDLYKNKIIDGPDAKLGFIYTFIYGILYLKTFSNNK